MSQINPAQVQQQFESGLAMHREGKLGLAQSHYQRTVKLDPSHADAWHLLGVVAFQTGSVPMAIKNYRQALALRPRFAQAWNNLALALKAKGDAGAAADAFSQALAVRPEYVEAAYNLGLLLEADGRMGEAEGTWRQALQWQADHVPSLTNLGNLLRRAQRPAESERLLARAWELAPDAETAGNLALVLLDLARMDAARKVAQLLTAQWPEAVDGWEILGAIARLQNDMDAALPALERAVALDPRRGGAWFELGLTRKAVGDHDGAMAALSRAKSLLGDVPRLRWAHALSVPALATSDAQIDAALEHFARGLDELEAVVEGASAQQALAELEAAGTVVPFHLHYLPRDTTALQLRFGRLVGRAVSRALPELSAAVDWRSRAHGGRLRVGFVSGFWTRHTVARYFADLVGGLDAQRFERFVWHTGERHDDSSRTIESKVEQFRHRSVPVNLLAQEIRSAQLDVLVYPDIGMDSRQHVLAAMRLAPKQIALYGHPVTTGLDNVDVYVSAAAYEPAKAQSHYREHLVCLPGLGAAPQRWDVAPLGDWFAPLKGDRPALLCLQNLSKITPAFDRVLLRILVASGAQLFLFDRSTALTRNYIARLADRATQLGVNVDGAVSVIGARAYPEFLGAVAGAELVLDTDWFSGGSTSLDAIAIGTPVLTWRAPMARGRQTAGMLQMLGITELTCDSEDKYVDRAVALLGDTGARRELGRRLRDGAAVLFESADAQFAFARLLEELADEVG